MELSMPGREKVTSSAAVGSAVNKIAHSHAPLPVSRMSRGSIRPRSFRRAGVTQDATPRNRAPKTDRSRLKSGHKMVDDFDTSFQVPSLHLPPERLPAIAGIPRLLEVSATGRIRVGANFGWRSIGRLVCHHKPNRCWRSTPVLSTVWPFPRKTMLSLCDSVFGNRREPLRPCSSIFQATTNRLPVW